ncbi:MAG: hypothetical protein K6G83_12975 [Lachnospiraceae bacterium]|nr:hypothetical protein [Lachnospiraceae bacterium]
MEKSRKEEMMRSAGRMVRAAIGSRKKTEYCLWRRYRKIFLALMFFCVAVIMILHGTSRAYAADQDTAGTKYYKSIMIYGGDTLESVAEQYMTDEYESKKAYMKEVAFMNHLHVTGENGLIPGNYIIIPYYLP